MEQGRRNRKISRLMVFGIVAAFVLGGTQIAISKKHSHKINIQLGEIEVVTAPDDVGGGGITCPTGYVATGGGLGHTAGIATPVASGFFDRASYYTLINNVGISIPSVTTVQVACIKETTAGARPRPLTRAQVEARVDAKIDSLEEALRTAD